MIQKRAIALLITVFFIMLITISIAIGLKYINTASKDIQKEQFLLQNSMIVENVVNMLKNSLELNRIDSGDDLASFLSKSSYLELQSNGVTIMIKLYSARSKINPNTLLDEARFNAFKIFLTNRMIYEEYADMLKDVMSIDKNNILNTTDIFINKPNLFRGYISSYNHLEEIRDNYLKKYHDNTINTLNMYDLFYISYDKNSVIDLNYANSWAWEMMIECSHERAIMISKHTDIYSNMKSIGISDEEQILLGRFQTSFFEPYLDVSIKIQQKERTSNIRFEYNIETKKGTHFVFEV